jgi:hypothetical protein
MSSTNRDNFISSFPIWIPFISFSCLIALASISSMRLNRSRELGSLSCSWSYKKHFQLFTIEYDVVSGLSHMSFLCQICWECLVTYVLSMPNLLRMSFMKEWYILSNALSAFIVMIVWFLSFIWWMWCVTFIDFLMSNHFASWG